MAVNFIIKQITQKWYLNKMSHQKFMPTVDNIKLFPFPLSAAELSWSCLFLTLRVDQESEGCQLCDKLSFKAKTLISHLLASPQEITNKRNSLCWYKGIKAPTLTSPILSVFTVHLLCSAAGDLEEERRSPTVLVF